jgi:hypothetical protein
MKTRIHQKMCRFELQVMAYGNRYYIERIARLESALAKKPRVLQIDLIGVGEILADFALIIRSVLVKRSSTIRVVTNACSSLQGGSVLVWLMGETRLIREDAKVFFRKANLPEEDDEPEWKDKELSLWDSSDLDPEEGDYARVLQLINEFLPVKEMAGRLVSVPELKQFGLVENQKLDALLETAFSNRVAQAKSSNASVREQHEPRRRKPGPRKVNH